MALQIGIISKLNTKSDLQAMNSDRRNRGISVRGGPWRIGLLAAIGLIAPFAAFAQSDLKSLLESARQAERGGDFAAAERVYQQALQLSPGNAETLKRLGVVEQTELKLRDSIGHFKTVLSQDANYPEVNFFLGVSYLGLDDFGDAIHSFQQELTTQKPHPRCRYYLGLAYESSGHREQAISQFTQAVAGNPKDADALYQLARIYKNASLEAIERLRALDPDSFQLHVLQGELDSDSEKYSEAIKQYEAALAKQPGAMGIHFAIGVAYWVQYEIAPAKEEFLLALKENPNDALTNLYLGDIAVRDREYEEATRYLKAAGQGQADAFRVHLLLGKCYRAQREFEKAKLEFQAAISTSPNVPEAHYLMAQVFQELHDSQGSEKELAEFQRLSGVGGEKAPVANPQY
jgi:tetratricopeptide (TPR) repeat protein